tara:strand:- start:159062 stop:159802 length:741 start_codon:yes stop_codon:yes gene_type:complete
MAFWSVTTDWNAMLAAIEKQPQILIVEDDPELSDQLSSLLRSRGYDIQQQFDGEAGLIAALRGSFDLILLDVLLPAMDGFSVLNHLRRTRQTPVMLLTACGAEEERIVGFSKGADDYVPKPFNFTELQLRIEALLRRAMGVSSSRGSQQKLVVDTLQLDRQQQAVTVDGVAVTLTPIQFKLLWVLVLHQHEVLSKAYLYRLVLEREFSRYDRSLDMHLSRVRRKLVDAGMASDRLQTVHGTGYCFS